MTLSPPESAALAFAIGRAMPGGRAPGADDIVNACAILERAGVDRSLPESLRAKCARSAMALRIALNRELLMERCAAYRAAPRLDVTA